MCGLLRLCEGKSAGLRSNEARCRDKDAIAHSVLASCHAQSYAIGAAAVWLLAIQAAWRSGPKAPPKGDVAPPPVPVLDSNGKVAAKAA